MVFDKVKEIIAEIMSCDPSTITLDASLKDEIGLDSLDAMEVSLQLEDEYDLKIEEDALKNFVTVRDIVDYLEKHCA